MNPNIILLVDADTETCAATLAAARAGRFDVRFAQIQRDLSELTELNLDDIALIVLDYDADVHGPAIEQMLDRWQPPRPVILVSSDEGLTHPLMFLGGNARHLTKPVTLPRLVHAIQTLVPHARSCDRWGHPYTAPRTASLARNPQKVAA